MKNKKHIIILAVIVIITILSGCNLELNNNLNTGATTTAYVEKLSDNCDKVLASGSYEGNDYELVAVSNESYDDVEIKIGVIKNNEWLVPLTTDMPFVYGEGESIPFSDKRTLFYEHYGTTSDLDDIDENYDFNFIGNGCFICEASGGFYNAGTYIIYNSELNEEVIIEKDEYIESDSGSNYYKYQDVFYELNNHTSYYGGDKYISRTDAVCNDKILVTETGNDEYIIKILDTNTMEMKNIMTIADTSEFGIVCGPLEDDLFAVTTETLPQVTAFYNIYGNKIIDLSEYEIIELEDQYPHFMGTFTFITQNSAGTKYKLSIDKQGNVVNTQEITDDE